MHCYSIRKKIIALVILLCWLNVLFAQHKAPFRVLGFYTARQDAAHISFVHEANKWFAGMATQYDFIYDSTNDWNNLNKATLVKYQVLVFLDTRPDSISQRKAFEQYMKKGGAWMGFHFSAFALTPSDYPQNWDWYHQRFLGSGEYVSNTWQPTTATLKIEIKKHPVTANLPDTLTAAPNEWYRWKNDMRKNSSIKILAAIDSSSFPLGTGPKPNEIWHSGYYPVVWTNTAFRMIYFNMGHNDMDYESGSNATLSSTFSQPFQNKMIINALLWLAKRN